MRYLTRIHQVLEVDPGDDLPLLVGRMGDEAQHRTEGAARIYARAQVERDRRLVVEICTADNLTLCWVRWPPDVEDALPFYTAQVLACVVPVTITRQSDQSFVAIAGDVSGLRAPGATIPVALTKLRAAWRRAAKGAA